jgi:disulfide bond formation protein DsbB
LGAEESVLPNSMDWRDALGLVSVAMAIVAAGIYLAQTLRGSVSPHPLSWFVFGLLSATGYWIQRDAGARQGSWTLLAMTVICFLFVAASLARGERSFSRLEWSFAAASVAVFGLYFFTKEATLAAAMTTLIDALGYGPTFVRGWSQPHKDSATSFALNGAKFVPSLAAMDPINFATSSYPLALLVLNAAVTVELLVRRRALAVSE